jgi:hypothetical protein
MVGEKCVVGVAMYKVWRLRAMGAICRKYAVYDSARSIRLIAEAEYWEHLADHELAVHSEECNAYRSNDETKAGQSGSPDAMRWEIAVATRVRARERLGAENLAG